VRVLVVQHHESGQYRQILQKGAERIGEHLRHECDEDSRVHRDQRALREPERGPRTHNGGDAEFRESLWRNKVAVVFVCACFAGAFFVCLVLPGGDLFLLPWQRVDLSGPPTTKRELGTVISVRLAPGAMEPVRLAEISYGGFTAEVMARLMSGQEIQSK
jgi:hypothetical protein